MEKWALLLLVFFNLKADSSWIGIDCGANQRTINLGIIWQTDETFIQTGTIHFVPTQNLRALPILNTLRAFTQQNKNCYTLPAQTGARYFVRAVFYYANYDGLSHPPTFDLQIDGNKLVTVVSSSTEIRYYEILYRSKGSRISVCLARTRDDQFPFISSLEAWTIPDTMYTKMSQGLAWLNSYRYNYGGDNWILGYPDNYSRIWEPMAVPGAINTTADQGTVIFEFPYEYPPDSAILDAVESENETTSLFLTFGPIKTTTTIYIEVYFTEMSLLSTGSRSFDVYFGDQKLFNVIPQYGTCTAGLAVGQTVNENITIELRPTQHTLLPPIISAIEIYTASDPLVTSGTDQQDLNGLMVLTSTFDRLKGWSGEPCLPEDNVWQWLGCKGSDPPRVTSINLSGYGLNGKLPEFSQMQALEDIDLSNNSLSGHIPGFLGELPNLKNLNLSYNGFSGKLPSSIRDNKRLMYDINGNPNVDASGKDKSSTAMIIGLAVGIPLVVILLIIALVFWQIRRRSNQGQNQDTEAEGNGFSQVQNQDTEAEGNGSSQGQNQEKEPGIGKRMGSDMKADNESMVPDMDLDELEQLIDESRESYIAKKASDDDSVVVGEIEANASNDQSMVPDIDLEELDEIIRDQRRADELAGHKGDS